MNRRQQLHWETVSDQLRQALETIQRATAFADFRLVGGTALSLLRGHRISTDIDLFSTVNYTDFQPTDCLKTLRELFPVVDPVSTPPLTTGGSIFIGHSKNGLIKLDLWHEEPFIRNEQFIDSIRLAHLDDLVAMKCNVTAVQPRKKDIWDLHLLASEYTYDQAVSLYRERYPYSFDSERLRWRLLNLDQLDNDFDPICLLGKEWPLVKYDIALWINE